MSPHVAREAERTEANAALRHERDRAQRYLDTAEVILLALDLEGRVTLLNRKGCDVLGWGEDELIKQNWIEKCIPARLQSEIWPQFTRLIAGDVSIVENWVVTKNGEERLIDWRNRVLHDDAGRVTGTFSSGTDITETKRVMEALKESRSALRALATSLRNMREAERAHLAREIHDGFGQALTALRMDLSSLRSMPAMTPSALRRFAAMQTVIDDAIESVQTMATDLRPAVLDHFGLTAAIEEEVRQFRDRAGITCELDLPRNSLPIRGRQATDAFRILQEALTNVARHAKARAVRVQLRIHEGSMELAVADDGIGMQPTTTARRPALGLLGMSERAIAWGGDISIDDVAPHGTCVTARMPLSDAT